MICTKTASMRQINDRIQESNNLLSCTFPMLPKNSLRVVSVKNVMQSTTAPKPMHAPNRVESISLRACFIVAWYGVLTRFVCTNIKEYKELYGITLYFCLASCRLHQLKCHHSLGNARKPAVRMTLRSSCRFACSCFVIFPLCTSAASFVM